MALNQTVEPNLLVLEEMFAKQTDYLHIIQKLQGLLDDLVRQTTEIPFWKNEELSLEELAIQIDLYDWYRCVLCCSTMVAFVLACFAIIKCVFWVAEPKAMYVTTGALGPVHWFHFLEQKCIQFKWKFMATTFSLIFSWLITNWREAYSPHKKSCTKACVLKLGKCLYGVLTR